MANNDNRAETDITDLILDEHGDFRCRFVDLWDLRHSGDTGGLSAAWQPLADLLEVHASAEEEIFYPVLLKRGSDEALRSRLGARWVAFHAEHRAARGIPGENIDPEEYIVDNS